MTMTTAAAALYRDGGASRLVRRGVERLLLRSRVATPTSRDLYWRLAPAVYRNRYRPDTAEALVPPDPFAVHPVDPARISRFSRREYPPYRHRWRLFGAVRDGDWDVRPASSAPEPPGAHPPRDLLYADRLEETPLYRSFEAHFRRGVPWAETPFVRALLARLPDEVWHGCDTEAKVLDRCAEMDRLYESLQRDGCESQVDRARRGVAPWGFLDALGNEIVVDVGRDGDLLLVSGKHRLTVAKLAGLDRVPVAFLVRHRAWMETRDAVARGEREGHPHPDLPFARSSPDVTVEQVAP